MALGRWITVFRAKTCATCAGNSGQVREFADWAQRPEGLPPIHPNCWCEVVPLDEFTDDDAAEFEDAFVDLGDALAALDELDDPFDVAAELRDIAGDIRRGGPIG